VGICSSLALKFPTRNTVQEKNVSRPGNEPGTKRNLNQIPTTVKPEKRLNKGGKKKILITGGITGLSIRNIYKGTGGNSVGRGKENVLARKNPQL
jgi:hypothetical protein